MSLIGTANAAVPTLLSLQGKVTNSTTGEPVSSGDIKVEIYDTATGGSWTFQESHTSAVGSDGIFDVLVGSISSLEMELNRDYYMEVYVNDSEVIGDGVGSGRRKFTASGGEIDGGDIKAGTIDPDTALIQDAIDGTEIQDDTLTADDLNVNVVSSVDGVFNDGGDIDLIPGTGITITPDDVSDEITIACTVVDTNTQCEDQSCGTIRIDDGSDLYNKLDTAAQGGAASPLYWGNEIISVGPHSTDTRCDTSGTCVEIYRGTENIDARYINVGESGDSILDGTIDSSEIEDDTLTASDLATGSVTTTEIASNTILAGDIASNAVGSSEIATNAVTTTEIAADTITASDIASNAIGAAELSSSAIQSGDIGSGDLPANGYASTYLNEAGDTSSGALTLDGTSSTMLYVKTSYSTGTAIKASSPYQGIYSSGSYMGVVGLATSGSASTRTGVRGSAFGGTGSNYGVYGYSGGTSGNRYGVYGSASGSGTYGVYASGNLGASGTKTAVVRTSYGPLEMYAIESPDVWFEDLGKGKLMDGEAVVELDPVFLETVTIDEEHPMIAFVQLTGECPRGVYVSEGTDSFTVKTNGGAPCSATFNYRVTASRKGYEDLRMNMTDAGYNDPTLYPENFDIVEEQSGLKQSVIKESFMKQAIKEENQRKQQREDWHKARKDWKRKQMQVGN